MHFNLYVRHNEQLTCKKLRSHLINYRETNQKRCELLAINICIQHQLSFIIWQTMLWPRLGTLKTDQSWQVGSESANIWSWHFFHLVGTYIFCISRKQERKYLQRFFVLINLIICLVLHKQWNFRAWVFEYVKFKRIPSFCFVRIKSSN